MPLQRRDFIVGAGATTALLLAGCADQGEDLEQPSGDGGTAPDDGTETPTRTVTPLLPTNLDVTGLTARAEGDRTVVEITIENVGDEPGGGTLVVTATVDGEQGTREQQVELEPGDSRTYEIEFDMPAEERADISAVDFGWESQTGSGDGSGG